MPISITKILAVAGLIAVGATTVYIHAHANEGFRLPLYHTAMSALAKQHVEKRYGRLFAALALRPAAQDQLENLLAQRQMANERAEIDAANSKTVKYINNEIRSAFGLRVAHAISAYDGIAQFYRATDEMQVLLSHTPTPLQPAQADQLVTLLVQALGPKVYTSYWAVPDSVITQAASILSAPQIEILKQIQQKHEARIEARNIRLSAANPCQ
jgi:hypothetical protein